MKTRLDAALIERGLADSRRRAQGLILAGAVRVDGATVTRAGASVPTGALIEVKQPEDEYVSRGAHKLRAALEAFTVPVTGRVAVDIGASTGGFTDLLLREGARRVYAIDVGYGQLAWRLREDPRVVLMERTNFRHLESLPEVIELAAVDVSFISLALILPALVPLLKEDADVIALIKPQFEAGKERVGKRGVVRDPSVHRDVLLSVLGAATAKGWVAQGLIASPILGPAGNREFLAHLRRDSSEGGQDVEAMIDAALRGDEGT